MDKKGNISNKQITINMLANIVSYSSNILISFVLTPFLINTLGKETYSFYPMANTIVSYMSVLLNSMNSITSRFVTVSLVQEKREEANKYFSSTLAANLLMSLLLFVPMAIVVILLDSFMEVPINSVAAIKGLFALVFASALINISAAVFGIATFAKNRIDLRSLRELITAVLRLGLFYLLYKILTPSIIYVGIVTLIVAIVNIVFQFNYTKMLLPEIKISKSYISWKHTKELLSSSIWNAINTFGNTLLAGTSMILANLFYGATASGSYSVVQTVPQFINGIISMLIGVFFPVITYKYAEHDKQGLLKEIKRTQNMVGMFGCAVISVFSALANEFFKLWTPGENSHELAILSFCTILPHAIIACVWTLTNLNIVMNKIKIPALITLISGVLNIFIAFIAYKFTDFGLISLPVISSLLQIIWIGIFIPQYACKNIHVKWYEFYPPVIKALVTSGIVMVVILFIKKFFYLNSWLKLFIFGGISGVIALLLFGFVMLGTKQIKILCSGIISKIKK